MLFTHKIGMIFKGKLVRTLEDKTSFAKAHNHKNVYNLPPFSLEEIQYGQGHLDHDIQVNNLEQLLNRMIIDNGKEYTINMVLDLLKSAR